MVVEIKCPRCEGHGERFEWTPDEGVCYRCGGSQVVRINVDFWLQKLTLLRRNYAELRGSANVERLKRIEKFGKIIHKDLEIVRASYPKLRVDWSPLKR
jgi:hypothetical protein